MTEEEQRHLRVAEIVAVVARLPKEERDSYLEQACTDDPTLTLDVRQHLRTLPPPSQPFSIGDRIGGRFRILRRVAEGGMGVVYEAIDEKLNVRRALKCAKLGFGGHLPPEARSALRVTHPNVCRVFEIHSAPTAEGAVDFLSMEFIDGATLATHLRKNGTFPDRMAREIGRQICAGLAAAHDQELLHRDLKSHNILLATDKSGNLRAAVTTEGRFFPNIRNGDMAPGIGR